MTSQYCNHHSYFVDTCYTPKVDHDMIHTLMIHGSPLIDILRIPMPYNNLFFDDYREKYQNELKSRGFREKSLLRAYGLFMFDTKIVEKISIEECVKSWPNTCLVLRFALKEREAILLEDRYPVPLDSFEEEHFQNICDSNFMLSELYDLE